MDDTTPTTALAVRQPRRTRASWPSDGKKGNPAPSPALIFDGSIDSDEPTAFSYSPDYPCPHELRARVRGTWPTAQTERAAQARGQARAVGQAAEQAEAARLGVAPPPLRAPLSQVSASQLRARAVGVDAEHAEAERLGVAQLEAQTQRLQLQALLRSCLAAAGDLLSQAAQTAADLQRPSAAALLELSGRLDRLLEAEPS